MEIKSNNTELDLRKIIDSELDLRKIIDYDFSNSCKEHPWCVKKDIAFFQPLNNWRFETEKEAYLAASMWLNIPIDKKDINQFRFQFNHVLRILGNTESVWSK